MAHGRLTVQVTHLIFSINLFGSIFFLTCMSVDRYLSHRLRRQHTHGRREEAGAHAVCDPWCGCWPWRVPARHPTYLKTVTSASNETYCRAPSTPEGTASRVAHQHGLVSVVLGFAIPFSVIAVFYFLLARAARLLQ